VKMWKGSVLEGNERLYVCTFVSSCRRNNDAELIARSSPAPSPRFLPRQRVHGQDRSARKVSTRSILSHCFMFACGVMELSRSNRGVASALKWGRDDVWRGVLHSSLTVSLAMMLGCGRASGKAVHSPINAMSSLAVQVVATRGTRWQ